MNSTASSSSGFSAAVKVRCNCQLPGVVSVMVPGCRDDQHGLIHFRGHGREAVALFDELAAIGQDQFWLLAAVWVCFISEVRFSETKTR